jgi:hypothetical protein
MTDFPPFTQFFPAARQDPRITAAHISVYVALLFCWFSQDCLNPFQAFSQEIMPYAKISGRGTFYRLIGDLASWGYIRYESSHNHFAGSLVSILHIDLPK